MCSINRVVLDFGSKFSYTKFSYTPNINYLTYTIFPNIFLVCCQKWNYFDFGLSGFGWQWKKGRCCGPKSRKNWKLHSGRSECAENGIFERRNQFAWSEYREVSARIVLKINDMPIVHCITGFHGHDGNDWVSFLVNILLLKIVKNFLLL